MKGQGDRLCPTLGQAGSRVAMIPFSPLRLTMRNLWDQGGGCPCRGVAAPMGGCWQQGMAGAVELVPGKRWPVGPDPDLLPAMLPF